MTHAPTVSRMRQIGRLWNCRRSSTFDACSKSVRPGANRSFSTIDESWDMQKRPDIKPVGSRHSHAWFDFGVNGVGSVFLALLAFFFSKNLTTLIPHASKLEARSESPKIYQESSQAIALKQLAATIVYDTEGTWSMLFSEAGGAYRRPQLALFSGATQSTCGEGRDLTGPFYCIDELKVYIDVPFFEALQQRLGARGDFAQAYVIAHAVGHHVQNLLGAAEGMRPVQRISKVQRNAALLRMELQADCYAGLWMRHSAESRPILTDGDIEAGLKGVSAVSYERLQTGRADGVLETFQHGSAEQRERWFKAGFEGGDIEDCDLSTVRRL